MKRHEHIREKRNGTLISRILQSNENACPCSVVDVVQPIGANNKTIVHVTLTVPAHNKP